MNTLHFSWFWGPRGIYINLYLQLVETCCFVFESQEKKSSRKKKTTEGQEALLATRIHRREKSSRIFFAKERTSQDATVVSEGLFWSPLSLNIKWFLVATATEKGEASQEIPLLYRLYSHIVFQRVIFSLRSFLQFHMVFVDCIWQP